MLLINGLSLAHRVAALGLYQCALAADRDLSALLYLIHDQASLLSFTTHILLFHASTILNFAKKKKPWLLKVHGLKYCISSMGLD